MNREEFLLRERDLAKKRSTVTVLSAKLLPGRSSRHDLYLQATQMEG
jgi:hypothetical protein